MTQIMALDPTRVKTFAITVQDASMTLWFCNRSGLITSEPFNFVEEVR